MADKLIYIPNDDNLNYPFCKLVFEAFGHSIECINQSKFNRSDSREHEISLIVVCCYTKL